MMQTFRFRLFILLLPVLSVPVITQAQVPVSDSAFLREVSIAAVQRDNAATRADFVAGILMRKITLDSITGNQTYQARDILSSSRYAATYEIQPGTRAEIVSGQYETDLLKTDKVSEAINQWNNLKYDLQELTQKGWTEKPYEKSGYGYDDDWIQNYVLDKEYHYFFYHIHLCMIHKKGSDSWTIRLTVY